MNDTRKFFQVRVQNFLDELQWTQKQLAKRAGLHSSQVCRWLAADGPSPSLDNIALLARTLGCKPSDLLP